MRRPNFFEEYIFDIFNPVNPFNWNPLGWNPFFFAFKNRLITSYYASCFSFFFVYWYGGYRDLHFFPTRCFSVLPPSQKVWKAIYDENCFFSSNSLIDVNYESFIEELCMEKRVFFRALSGLHSSISIHISAQYPILSKFTTMRTYGPNKKEFDRRFGHENGQHWLKNLYFLFLLEFKYLPHLSCMVLQKSNSTRCTSKYSCWVTRPSCY